MLVCVTCEFGYVFKCWLLYFIQHFIVFYNGNVFRLTWFLCYPRILCIAYRRCPILVSRWILAFASYVSFHCNQFLFVCIKFFCEQQFSSIIIFHSFRKSDVCNLVFYVWGWAFYWLLTLQRSRLSVILFSFLFLCCFFLPERSNIFLGFL